MLNMKHQYLSFILKSLFYWIIHNIINLYTNYQKNNADINNNALTSLEISKTKYESKLARIAKCTGTVPDFKELSQIFPKSREFSSHVFFPISKHSVLLSFNFNCLEFIHLFTSNWWLLEGMPIISKQKSMFKFDSVNSSAINLA